MKASDIPDEIVFQAIDAKAPHWAFIGDVAALVPDFPRKVVLAKCAQMIPARGLICGSCGFSHPDKIGCTLLIRRPMLFQPRPMTSFHQTWLEYRKFCQEHPLSPLGGGFEWFKDSDTVTVLG